MAVHRRNEHISKHGRNNRSEGSRPLGRPFWLPAANYYVLAAAVSLFVFLLAWTILRDFDEYPIVSAGIVSSLFLLTAVFLREYVLRRAQQRYLIARSQLDSNLSSAFSRLERENDKSRAALEKSAKMLDVIGRKSQAARVLSKVTDAHWEVVLLCDEYLKFVEREMMLAQVNSGRMERLRRGRQIASEHHKFHLLTWASAESRVHTGLAASGTTVAERTLSAQNAREILEKALSYYPDDAELNASLDVVGDLLASIKISHWIEQAERNIFRGEFSRAISNYRDALFFLGRDGKTTAEREKIAETIRQEIEKINESVAARDL